MTTALDFLTNGQTNTPVTLYGNNATSGPTWMQNYTQGLIAQSNAMASQPFPVYPGSQVAPFNPTQQQSFNEVQGLQGQYQGALGQAQQLASSSSNPAALQAASGYLPQAQNLTQGALSQTGLGVASPYLNSAIKGATPGAISQYMNPYINDVVKQADYQQNLNFNQNVMPQINDQFIRGGQYGSAANQREADRAAQSLNTSEQMNTGAILGQGYGTAQQGALAAAGITGQMGATAGSLGTQAQQAQLAAGQQMGALGQISGGLGYEQGVLGLQGANQVGQLGALGQTLGLQGASALNAAGNQQQALAQKSADTAYNTFQQQQQYPEQQATWLANLTKGLAGPYTTGAVSQSAQQQIPSSAQMYGSPLSQALGSYSALTGLGNMFGSSGGGLNSILGPGTSSQLGTTLDPNSVASGGSALSAGNLYSPNANVGSGVPAPNFSTTNMGLPGYMSMAGGTGGGYYHSGGPVFRREGGALPKVSDYWYVRDRRFNGADGQAVKRFGIGGVNWDTSAPPDVGGLSGAPSTGIGGIDWTSEIPGLTTPTDLSSLGPSASPSVGPSLMQSMPTASSSSSSPGATLGGALSLANQGTGLYNAGSRLIGGTGTSGTPLGSTLGTANDVYGLYNAAAHPGIATGISGAGGAADLYSRLSGNSLGALGQTLGGAGDLAGIYNAIKNPNAGNVASGALDAYRLYGLASNALAPSSAAPAVAGAAGTGSGILGSIASAGAVAVPAAAAGIAGEVINGIVQGNQRGPALTFDPMTGLTQNPNGKLPSGNSVAFTGNLGIGEGNNQALGSGQLYRLNPSGSASNNSVYDWLGQPATNEADQAFKEYQQSLQPAGTSTGNLPSAFGGLPSNNPQSALSQANTAYSDLFNKTGGASAWGMTQGQFQSALQALQGDTTKGGGSLNVGLG